MKDNNNDKYKGICCTCSHADSCGFLARHDHPIVFCEEFTVDCQPAKRFHTYMEAEKSQGSVMKEGLCVSCKKKVNCIDAKNQTEDCENFVLGDY